MVSTLTAEQSASLKTAFGQTVRQLGGNLATCSVTGTDPAQISRYSNLNDPTMAPVSVVLAAEAVAVAQGGQPHVIAALARGIGHELLPVHVGQGDIAEAASRVAVTSGKLLGDTVLALADGELSVAEAMTLRAGLDELSRVAAHMRARVEHHMVPVVSGAAARRPGWV